MVFHCETYCRDAFSKRFAEKFKFLWPFEVRDMYTRNRETQLYQFSRTFLDRADDLRCYCMDSSFFGVYPEFRGDIPIFNSLPKHLDLGGDTTQLQCFPVHQEIEDQENVQP